jgi:putative flippase GtrA
MSGLPPQLQKLVAFGTRVFWFILCGLPAFLLAIPLNWVLVEKALLAKPLAYAIVLVTQVTINFFMARHFVFKPTTDRSPQAQFALFLVGILGFRVLDWGLYTLIVSTTQIYYLLVQAGNVLLFAVLKFVYSRFIFEGRGNVDSKPAETGA